MAKDPKDRKQTIEAVKRNWQAEVETAQTYRDLAGRERHEKRHAQRWEKNSETSAQSRLF